MKIRRRCLIWGAVTGLLLAGAVPSVRAQSQQSGRSGSNGKLEEDETVLASSLYWTLHLRSPGRAQSVANIQPGSSPSRGRGGPPKVGQKKKSPCK